MFENSQCNVSLNHIFKLQYIIKYQSIKNLNGIHTTEQINYSHHRLLNFRISGEFHTLFEIFVFGTKIQL